MKNPISYIKEFNRVKSYKHFSEATLKPNITSYWEEESIPQRQQPIRHIHIVSQFVGSINEVTEGIIKGIQKNFIITREGEDCPEDYDILLCHYNNPSVTQSREFEKFRHKVLILPIDGTSIKENIIEEINKFDAVITPATAGKTIMRLNNVKVPIYIIPNWYNSSITFDLKRNDSLERLIKNRYVFYHESTCHPRKGIKEMCEAFVDAFSSNIKKPKELLIIKTSPHNKGTYKALEDLKKYISNIQKQYTYPSEIIMISQWLSKTELNQLMQRCDCYVQPSKIEGFGIPLLRAAALDKQIIAIKGTCNGFMDFLSPYNRFLSEGELEIAQEEINPIYTSDTKWLKIDVEDLSKKMFISAQKVSRFGHTLSEKISLEKYEYTNVMNMYIDFFNNDLLQDKNYFIEEKIEDEIIGVKYICPRGTSGYSQAAKDYIIGLFEQVPVTVEYLIFDNSDYITGDRNKKINSLVNSPIKYNKVIIHSTPEHWTKIILEEKEKNKNVEIIGMTVWETDKIPDIWVKWINQTDKIIVPCTWNKKVFQESGIIKPIEVIPHILTPTYNNTKLKLPIKDNTYCFYTIGQWSYRKGIDDSLKSYLNEFDSDDDVCFIIKTFNRNYSNDEKQIIRNNINFIMKSYKKPAQVVLLLDEMTDEQIYSLHKRCHCYISLAKSEGFGLGMFDAVCLGNTVISTGYGGQTDFIKDNLVKYDLIPVSKMNWIPWYEKDQKWAQPNIDHASILMRNTFNNKISPSINYVETIRKRHDKKFIIKKILTFLKK